MITNIHGMAVKVLEPCQIECLQNSFECSNNDVLTEELVKEPKRTYRWTSAIKKEAIWAVLLTVMSFISIIFLMLMDVELISRETDPGMIIFEIIVRVLCYLSVYRNAKNLFKAF